MRGFENARNLKFLLCYFKQILLLKINFSINEAACLGEYSSGAIGGMEVQ
jgi:hypothetical protein